MMGHGLINNIDNGRPIVNWKKATKAALAAVALVASSLAAASQDEFCAGFEEGFRSIKGSMAMLPLCPLAPLTPLGSTAFREGIKAGIRAAYGSR